MGRWEWHVEDIGGNGGGDGDVELGSSESGVEILHGREGATGEVARNDLVANSDIAEAGVGLNMGNYIILDPGAGEGWVVGESLEVIVKGAECDLNARFVEGGKDGRVGVEEVDQFDILRV